MRRNYFLRADTVLYCDGGSALRVDAAYAEIVARLYPEAVLVSTKRLTGGVSADVFQLDLQFADGEPCAVVLRIHGESHSGHPAKVEYQLLQALHENDLPVPTPLLVDVSGAIIPEPFLVMSFIEGSTEIPEPQMFEYIDSMAAMLVRIHSAPTKNLPGLPLRLDPLPEVFEFLPEGDEWTELHGYLQSRNKQPYTDEPQLLHGDYWPENLLWQDGAVAAVLDWEDAAVGDPLSDVAACRVELRYKFGVPGMQRFTETYAKHRTLDYERLALWQVYVAAAAQRYMGDWGLPAEREAHMRLVALASIREAADDLMAGIDL